MKTRGLFIIIISLCLALIRPASGQPDPESYDCVELTAIIDDATGAFKKHWGELLYEDFIEEIYEYGLGLWNETERNAGVFYYDEGEYIYTEFLYHYTEDKDEGIVHYNYILEKVKNCLPSDYFISGDHNEYTIEYTQFSDERDAGDTDNNAYPQVEVSLAEWGSQYAVSITIYAPSR